MLKWIRLHKHSAPIELDVEQRLTSFYYVVGVDSYDQDPIHSIMVFDTEQEAFAAYETDLVFDINKLEDKLEYCKNRLEEIEWKALIQQAHIKTNG